MTWKYIRVSEPYGYWDEGDIEKVKMMIDRGIRLPDYKHSVEQDADECSDKFTVGCGDIELYCSEDGVTVRHRTDAETFEELPESVQLMVEILRVHRGIEIIKAHCHPMSHVSAEELSALRALRGGGL